MGVVEYLYGPGVEETLDFVVRQVVQSPEKRVLMVLGSCQVRYQGRARSFLDWGERILIVKEDGTSIIHQPSGREPVNWQPHGARATYLLQDRLFTVHVVHRKNRERMAVSFKKIEMVFAARMDDRARVQIVGMERDIVDKIMENPELIEPGLRITQREKKTRSGLIDLFGYDRHHVPVVIEVKRSQATISAAQQLRMYVTDLKRGNDKARIRGILCTPRIPEMVCRLLDDYGLEYREFGWQHQLFDDQQTSLEDY
ncbi:MAG: endonuclease NucS [Candidatus Thermoplasmatota archaeon]|nr:endonuclease NucS [Candidatus Thermoplasmatota archaeon]MDD5777929.1 endonuclease NucS [Candidatus Thermoplasmatota archaeon]